MATSPSDKPGPAPKRRRFQYSLRTLLLLMTALALWMGVVVHRAKRQREAVTAVERLGGDVWYDYEYGYDEQSNQLGRIYENPRIPGPSFLHALLDVHYFSGVYCVNLGGLRVSTQLLERLADSTNIRHLSLCRVPLPDDHMAHIGRMRHMEWLGLAETGIGDRQLECVKDLTRLRALALERNPITDDGLAHLANLDRLMRLSLEETRVTDDGLVHLSGLTALRSLELDGLPITDAGLVHLEPLSALIVLDLHETAVTDEGVKRLQQALPNAEIRHLGPKY